MKPELVYLAEIIQVKEQRVTRNETKVGYTGMMAEWQDCCNKRQFWYMSGIGTLIFKRWNRP